MLTMNATNDWYRRVESLYQAVLDQRPECRADYLIEQCRGDQPLRREVETLLACYDAAKGSFLDDPAHALASRSAEPAPVSDRIGRYRILGVLGQGGMGIVYRAEQENPRREVALKVMRSGLVGSDLLRRFELEAAFLARLRHPGIAQIYEAGLFDDGDREQPFFAMELVNGEQLIQFVRQRGPTIPDRLKLFIEVCAAVQHAHQKSVIHRDLKPANILVVEGDGHADSSTDHTAGKESGKSRRTAIPKILDFGVARTTDSDVQATTLYSDTGRLVGTLAYMSPEQIEGQTARLDTRADVYALGVILYELLTERLPFDVSNTTIANAVRIICEQEPDPPGAINRALRGDLNTIVLKALEKDPERRYASASDLAADLQRYLENQPITARPATTMYQFRKFARRNRGLVAGVTCAFVALIAGVIASVTFAAGQSRALAESKRQHRIAQAVNDFLNKDLLGKANPYGGATHDATLREVLDGASEAIETRFLDEPLVHASIRATLGQTYYQLGAYDEAERHLEPAIRIYSNAPDTGSTRAAELQHVLVLSLLQDWKLEEAESVLDDMIAALKPHEGRDPAQVAVAYGDLGILRKRQGRFSESEQAYRKALEFCEKSDGMPLRQIAVTKENLALVLHDQHKSTEAETLLAESVTDFKTTSGEDSADVAYALTNLGHVGWANRPGEEGLSFARDCFERAYAIRVRRLGENHPETLRTRGSIAKVISRQGDYLEAERINRDVLERRLAIMEEDHIDVLDSLNYIADALEHQERYAEALDLYRLTLKRAQARYGPEHFHVRRFRSNLLALLRRLDDREGLTDTWTDYLAALEAAAEPADAPYQTLNAFAWHLLTCEVTDMRDPVRALAVAERAIENGGRGDPSVLDTRARALAENGRTEEAIAALDRALELLPSDDSALANEIAVYRDSLRRGMTDAPTPG
jgi:tetratricopeptide (TPR) repeat protein